MCALGVVIIGAHAHVQKNVMTDPECVAPEIGQPKSKTATSMGLAVGRWSIPRCSVTFNKMAEAVPFLFFVLWPFGGILLFVSYF